MTQNNLRYFDNLSAVYDPKINKIWVSTKWIHDNTFFEAATVDDIISQKFKLKDQSFFIRTSIQNLDEEARKLKWFEVATVINIVNEGVLSKSNKARFVNNIKKLMAHIGISQYFQVKLDRETGVIELEKFNEEQVQQRAVQVHAMHEKLKKSDGANTNQQQITEESNVSKRKTRSSKSEEPAIQPIKTTTNANPPSRQVTPVKAEQPAQSNEFAKASTQFGYCLLLQAAMLEQTLDISKEEKQGWQEHDWNKPYPALKDQHLIEVKQLAPLFKDIYKTTNTTEDWGYPEWLTMVSKDKIERPSQGIPLKQLDKFIQSGLAQPSPTRYPEPMKIESDESSDNYVESEASDDDDDISDNSYSSMVTDD